MNVETLIYGYSFICICMIIFNLIYIFVIKNTEAGLGRYSYVIEAKVLSEIRAIKSGNKTSGKHYRYLNRKLNKVRGLMAFDYTLERLTDSEPELITEYIKQINSVFTYLSVEYIKKSSDKAAYFAYVLTKYKVSYSSPFDPIADVMIEYLYSENLYCRQNAMKALYSFGNEEKLIKAMKTLDNHELFLHEKLYTNGLLSFSGDHKKLIELLWEEFDEFNDKTKVVIMTYIRFKSGDHCKKMYEVLIDENKDSELHFSAIRYFGKYQYSPALPILYKYVQYKNNKKWLYTAISAIALVNYPGEETIVALKKALNNANWYVRYNAAQSLEKLGLAYNELIDVINGEDRYAREIMMYRLQSRNLNMSENLVMIK